MRLVRIVLLSLALFTMPGCLGFGIGFYTYEGQTFVSFDPPYDATLKVTGSMVVPELEPDLDDVDISDRVIAYKFDNGVGDELNEENTEIILFFVSTDGTGAIVAWRIFVFDDEGRQVQSFRNDVVGDFDIGADGVGFGQSKTAGAWTREQ